ncbi:hypothetical protein [Aquabacter sediminis]|uniref:hypothetical protein n=1 Tax=Aquabacter sediminis TaxID=3029197 RepID=UPI00237E3CAC|nr:hypothetical protein [Aquabacter sp. P-9]MDE1569102.1 hypothetical protein [Aquabacter sp. P-9]
MCEVCAIFGAGEHWSDFGRLRDTQFPFADIQHYRAERARRIGLINGLVGPAGLVCEDWDGEALVLGDAQGRQKIVPTLNDLWPQVEALSGLRVDPLSEPLLVPVNDHG